MPIAGTANSAAASRQRGIIAGERTEDFGHAHVGQHAGTGRRREDEQPAAFWRSLGEQDEQRLQHGIREARANRDPVCGVSDDGDDRRTD